MENFFFSSDIINEKYANFETEKDDNCFKLYYGVVHSKTVIKLLFLSFKQDNNLRSPLLKLKFF